MKKLVLWATVTTLGAFVVIGSSSSPPPEDSDLQTLWSNLHACLRLDSAQVAEINVHLKEMEQFSRWLAENPGSLPTDSLSREFRKQNRDLKGLYIEHHFRYARVLSALALFRDAVDAKMPFDESKVGQCPS